MPLPFEEKVARQVSPAVGMKGMICGEVPRRSSPFVFYRLLRGLSAAHS